MRPPAWAHASTLCVTSDSQKVKIDHTWKCRVVRTPQQNKRKTSRRCSLGKWSVPKPERKRNPTKFPTPFTCWPSRSTGVSCSLTRKTWDTYYFSFFFFFAFSHSTSCCDTLQIDSERGAFATIHHLICPISSQFSSSLFETQTGDCYVSDLRQLVVAYFWTAQ